MFNRSSSSHSGLKPSAIHELKHHGSQETLSMLSRTMTATSINSLSSINNSFETNWLPNSNITTQKSYQLSLKLKPKEIELLRKSWAIVTSNDATSTDVGESGNINNSFNSQSFASYLFCVQFYSNLMTMDPEIERLVPNIKHQASAFAGVLQTTINTLEDLSKMKESLENLGRLHARILGIDSPYFQTMGHALIKTFQDWFGNSPDKFPIELEEAWIKLYCFLANSIIQGGIDPVIEYTENAAPVELDEEEAQESVDSFSLASSKRSITDSRIRSSVSSRFYDYHNKPKTPTPSMIPTESSSSSNAKDFNNSFNSSKYKFKKAKAKASNTAKDGDCIIM